jgi:hypothetical protein
MTGNDVHIFKRVAELAAYTRQTEKIFPRNHAKAGGLLKHLLRKIYY